MQNLLFHGRIGLSLDPHVALAPSPWGVGIVLVPVLGALAVTWITRRLSAEVRGSGVPEVMYAIHYHGGRMRPGVAVLKALASALSIGSGASVGREGPIVQIGAVLASATGLLARMPAHQRVVLLAGGAAAGIAATFNAPLGGLLAGRLARASRLPVPFRPAAAGAALGIMALWTPEVLGIGKETLRFAIIPKAFSAGELGLLLTAKIIATALCLGFGFAGGSFSPALVIGALYGALAGYVAAPLVPGAADSISVYAICGMAAVTSPVIGGPITTILIVFELTRNYELTTAVMVSVVFANLVSYRLFGRSMFDEALRARGCDLTMGRDQLVLDHSAIGAYVTRHFVEAHPGESLGVLRDRLIAAEATEAQLIDDSRNYIGTITLSRLLVAIAREPNATVDHIADWDDEALRVDTSIREALRHAESNIGEMLPVLEAGGGSRIVGVIAQSVIVRAYRDTLSGIRREEHAAP